MYLTVWQDHATQILFRGDLRVWFNETFEEGDHFVVRLEGPPDGPPDGLVLDKAEPGAVRETSIRNAEIVAVRPDWTDHRGLLGSYNPLTRAYLSTPFLQLLLRASEECRQAARDNREPMPFFLVLDEMNLARVEHYFADFLSALESAQPLQLHDVPALEEGESDSEDEETTIPQQLEIPENLFFLGTVNVDETTYLFSPKVLDRAFTIELNAVDLGGLGSGFPKGGDLDLVGWNGRLDPPVKPSREHWQWLREQEEGVLEKQITALHRILARRNRHFGYRVATEIARFVQLAVEQAENPVIAAGAALDLAVLQKVLVKLHGTRHELAVLLDELLVFALVGLHDDPARRELTAWRYLPDQELVQPIDESEDYGAALPRSAAKLWRMRARLQEAGFASWIE